MLPPGGQEPRRIAAGFIRRNEVFIRVRIMNAEKLIRRAREKTAINKLGLKFIIGLVRDAALAGIAADGAGFFGREVQRIKIQTNQPLSGEMIPKRATKSKKWEERKE